MSIFGRRLSVRWVMVLAAVLVIGTLLPVLSKTPSREVTLVARGMAFYVDGSAEPNPTIRLKAGETVRVVLRNEDRGITHDFAVPSLDEALEPINFNDVGTLTLDVPRKPGVYAYTCRPHALMMKGMLIVE